MDLMLLRAGGVCTRIPLWLVVPVLLGVLAAVVTAGYQLGQQQRDVVEIPVLPTVGSPDLELAERELAREGVESLASRLVELENRQARLDLRMSGLGDALDLDPEALEPETGGRGGASPPDTAAAVDRRIAALDHLLGQRDTTVARLDEAVRGDARDERMRPGVRPVESEAWVSSAFGYRDDPFTGERRFHSGMDYAGREGSEIRAAADGIVVRADTNGGFGRSVDIVHADGLLTRYAHNAELLVDPGERVEAGQPIARMGSTGRTTDTHLHFEVHGPGGPENPADYVHR
ncbi:M23 family metallopeptidase [Thioalkalivibrio sp. ALR17-21]|uniref:M23 family metallopeptidase n=1 Tax=Thioalkalivibrio sp. ALR17-21 TaxID=1269813 RepID=UPI00040FB117|nr:M23 family metallopeptidase [Thioalkalivibrio sp. ALR17-21]